MDYLIKITFTIFRILHSFPFKLQWHPTFELNLVLKNRRREIAIGKLITWISFIVLYCFWFFILLAFFIRVPVYLTNQKEYIRLAFHTIWIIGFYPALITRWIFYFHQTDVMYLVNETEKLMHNLELLHFGQNAFQNSKKTRKKLISLCCLHMYSCIGGLLLPMFIIFYGEPFQLDFFVSNALLMAFPTWKRTAFMVGIIGDLIFLVQNWGGYLMALHINLLFMHTFRTGIQNIIEQRRKFKNKRQLLEDADRNCFQLGRRGCSALRNDLLVYSKLRILTTLFNVTFGRIYVPSILGTFCTFLIEGILIAIRLSNGDTFLLMYGIVCFIGSAAILIMMISFMSMVHDQSSQLKKNLGRRRSAFLYEQEGKRLMRAFKVEAVKSGSFYGIKKITCVTMLGLLVNISGSMLISVRL